MPLLGDAIAARGDGGVAAVIPAPPLPAEGLGLTVGSHRVVDVLAGDAGRGSEVVRPPAAAGSGGVRSSGTTLLLARGERMRAAAGLSTGGPGSGERRRGVSVPVTLTGVASTVSVPSSSPSLDSSRIMASGPDADVTKLPPPLAPPLPPPPLWPSSKREAVVPPLLVVSTEDRGDKPVWGERLLPGELTPEMEVGREGGLDTAPPAAGPAATAAATACLLTPASPSVLAR
jgi:hypothetical protein